MTLVIKNDSKSAKKLKTQENFTKIPKISGKTFEIIVSSDFPQKVVLASLNFFGQPGI